MFRTSMAVGIAAIGLALLVADRGLSQQDKGEPAPAAKGQLPKYWNKIGLSDDQKQKLYAVHATYSAQIEGLNRQLRELKLKEKAEQEKILTDDQKTALRRIILEKAPKVPGDGAAPAAK
jgi:hypothetical protein